MPTNNPLPSSNLEDFKDNSIILDHFVNSQDNEYPDRFGRTRPTITGIIKEAFNVRTDISNMNETLIGQSRWDVVPKNTSLALGGDNGPLNKQAQALFNRTEMLKVHAREALRRTYLEVGLVLVPGSFEEGGELSNVTDILLEEKTGRCYSWTGSFPKVVNKGTLPTSELEFSVEDLLKLKSFIQGSLEDVKSGKFKPGTLVSITERDDGVFLINYGSGADNFSIINAGAGKIATLQVSNYINPKWFGAIPKTDSGSALQAISYYSGTYGIPVILSDVYYSSNSILVGKEGLDTFTSFEGPNTATQHMGQKGGIKFKNCDGFRIVQRSSLGLKNLMIWGDGENVIDYANYGQQLRTLIYSAVRSNEDTLDKNCIAYINNCNFRQWKTCWDFSRGAWSCHFENNYISYCFQAGVHFRPHSSRFIHNTIGYCIRGFELIEQASGKFDNNELNTGKYTEYLIKHTKVGAVSCCSNYIEHWESPTETDINVNYGLGFIPIIVEFDRFQTSSVAKIDNNLINTPGVYCCILFIPHTSQSQYNNTYRGQTPKDNLCIGYTHAEVVFGSTGTGTFMANESTLDIFGSKVKGEKLGGAVGEVFFNGSDSVTIFERQINTRAELTTLAASGDNQLFTKNDLVVDSSLQTATKGCRNSVDTRKMLNLTIHIEASTDATPAKLKVQVCKWESKSKIYEYDIPANSKVPIAIDFWQTPEFKNISNFYVTLENTTTQPSSLKVQAVRRFI